MGFVGDLLNKPVDLSGDKLNQVNAQLQARGQQPLQAGAYTIPQLAGAASGRTITPYGTPTPAPTAQPAGAAPTAQMGAAGAPVTSGSVCPTCGQPMAGGGQPATAAPQQAAQGWTAPLNSIPGGTGTQPQTLSSYGGG